MKNRPLTAPAALLLTGLLALTLAGCPSQPKVVDAPAEPVTVHRQVAGDQGGPTMFVSALVQDSDAAVELLGLDHVADLNIDFETSSLVVFGLGETPTGGYWLRVQSAQFDGERLFVQFMVNVPGDDEMVTQAITYPFAAAVIDRVPAGTLLRPEAIEVTGMARP